MSSKEEQVEDWQIDPTNTDMHKLTNYFIEDFIARQEGEVRYTRDVVTKMNITMTDLFSKNDMEMKEMKDMVLQMRTTMMDTLSKKENDQVAKERSIARIGKKMEEFKDKIDEIQKALYDMKVEIDEQIKELKLMSAGNSDKNVQNDDNRLRHDLTQSEENVYGIGPSW